MRALITASLLLACGGNGDAVDAGPDASDAAAVRDAKADGGDASLGVVRVPLTGCAPDYVAPLSLGGQTFGFSIDTGSSATAVASASCGTCDVSPTYVPGATASDLGKPVSATYGDGQTWSGELYEDDALFAALPSVRLDFAAITTQSSFFHALACGQNTTVNAAGILGLGPTIGTFDGTTSLLDALVAAGMNDTVAFELCPTGGSMWLGGFDPQVASTPVQYTPMPAATSSRHWYQVQITHIALGGADLGVGSNVYGSAMVDTGGQNFLVPTAVFDALTTQVGASPAFQQMFGKDATWFSSFANCVTLSQTPAEVDLALPGVELTLAGGVVLTLTATESYLRSVASAPSTYCVSIIDIKSTSFWDIGDTILQAYLTVIDRANQRMGFAPHAACP